MERETNGISEKQSGLGRVIDQLYGFFFDGRKHQYVVYAVSFVIAFSYAIVSDLALGKPQHEVAIESIVLASVLLICLPIAYVCGTVRRAERSHTKPHSTESPSVIEAVEDPSSEFASAFSRRRIFELTDALRVILSNEERQRQTQDLIATLICNIDKAQQHLPHAIEDLARTISKDRLDRDQLAGIGGRLPETISVTLSVAFEQSNLRLVAMLSEAIEQQNHDFLRMLSEVLEQQTGGFSRFRVPESSESDYRTELRRRGYAFDHVPGAR